MRRFKFTRQFDQMDCGPACIRMVAAHYGKDYLCVVINVLTYVNQNRNHLAVLDFST